MTPRKPPDTPSNWWFPAREPTPGFLPNTRTRCHFLDLSHQRESDPGKFPEVPSEAFPSGKKDLKSQTKFIDVAGLEQAKAEKCKEAALLPFFG